MSSPTESERQSVGASERRSVSSCTIVGATFRSGRPAPAPMLSGTTGRSGIRLRILREAEIVIYDQDEP